MAMRDERERESAREKERDNVVIMYVKTLINHKYSRKLVDLDNSRTLA